jgi:hypothetical protein
MIVEDQLDRRVGRIGGVEKREEFDEFAAAMAILDQRMDLAGDEVDASQTVCPSLKGRLTLDVAARVTRIGRAEPQTRRASHGPA